MKIYHCYIHTYMYYCFLFIALFLDKLYIFFLVVCFCTKISFAVREFLSIRKNLVLINHILAKNAQIILISIIVLCILSNLYEINHQVDNLWLQTYLIYFSSSFDKTCIWNLFYVEHLQQISNCIFDSYYILIMQQYHM